MTKQGKSMFKVACMKWITRLTKLQNNEVNYENSKLLKQVLKYPRAKDLCDIHMMRTLPSLVSSIWSRSFWKKESWVSFLEGTWDPRPPRPHDDWFVDLLPRGMREKELFKEAIRAYLKEFWKDGPRAPCVSIANGKMEAPKRRAVDWYLCFFLLSLMRVKWRGWVIGGVIREEEEG